MESESNSRQVPRLSRIGQAFSSRREEEGHLSTEKRISVPRIVQMLNPVRSKQTAQPLLHLAAATSLSTTTLQRFCHRIAVIDGIACPLAHQEDIPRYGKACRQADSADKCLQQMYINADIPRYS